MIQSAQGAPVVQVFWPFHQVVVADAFRLGLDRREIAAVVGLRVARAPVDLAVQDVRDEALLLLVGARTG